MAVSPFSFKAILLNDMQSAAITLKLATETKDKYENDPVKVKPYINTTAMAQHLGMLSSIKGLHSFKTESIMKSIKIMTVEDKGK